MMNYVMQLSACLDLKGCSMTPEVQGGNWCMWILRMMFYLLGMILGSKFFSFFLSSPWLLCFSSFLCLKIHSRSSSPGFFFCFFLFFYFLALQLLDVHCVCAGNLFDVFAASKSYLLQKFRRWVKRVWSF